MACGRCSDVRTDAVDDFDEPMCFAFNGRTAFLKRRVARLHSIKTHLNDPNVIENRCERLLQFMGNQRRHLSH